MNTSMLSRRFLPLLLALPLSTAGLAACNTDEPATMEDASDDPFSHADSVDGELTYDGKSYPYIYTGTLPKLDKPSITVSLLAHTARITGLLPVGWDEELPYYAIVKDEGTRRRLTVIYPIATGSATNGPGDYTNIAGLAYVPTNAHAAWGGFPYLEYNHKRGLAFHGPITASDGQWHLIRGPVSHGCNRMQGEHVVEMAQLLGMDMRKPHKSSERFAITLPVKIAYDWDKYEGKYVDVDYPAMKSVKRPPVDPAQTTLFRTWDSLDFPTLVCPYRSDRALGVDHCDYAGVDKYDLVTGELVDSP